MNREINYFQSILKSLVLDAGVLFAPFGLEKVLVFTKLGMLFQNQYSISPYPLDYILHYELLEIYIKLILQQGITTMVIHGTLWVLFPYLELSLYRENHVIFV